MCFKLEHGVTNGLPCQSAARLCRYVLISVGTMAAYIYSVFSIIYGRVSHGADYKASSQAAHLLPAAAELPNWWHAPYMLVFICGGSSARVPLPVSSLQLGQVQQLAQLTQSNPATHLAAQAVEFFETSALLITFIALGKLLEGAAKGRTSRVRF